MVTSEETHETATGLLIRRWLLLLLLLLLLRLSTIEEAAHELSGNTSKTPRTASRMRRILTTMLPTEQGTRKSNERRLILWLLLSSSECVQGQILMIAASVLFPSSSRSHIHLVDCDPFPDPRLFHPISPRAVVGKDRYIAEA